MIRVDSTFMSTIKLLAPKFGWTIFEGKVDILDYPTILFTESATKTYLGTNTAFN